MNETDKELPQEYEQIPWSHLVPVQKDRSLQLAMLVVVIAMALLAILFFVRRAPAVPVVAADPTPVVTESTVGVTSAPLFDKISPDSTIAAVAAPQIYSEADLMAVLPPPRSDMEAVARADWFVTDFFTVDGDGSLSDGVSASLPDAVELPESDGSAISYVEWARAVSVADGLDGNYTVTVWFRTLVGSGDSGFDRSPVRAVDIRIVTDSTGRLAIADLPIASSIEPVGIAPQWPVDNEAPPGVVAAAIDDAAQVGSDPQLQGAGSDEDGWRLVFSVGDASGLRFPIVVRISGS